MAEPGRRERGSAQASDAGTEEPDRATLEAHTVPRARPQPKGRSALFWLAALGVAFGVVGVTMAVAAGVAWYLVHQR